MTTPSLEVKDDITEFFPQDTEAPRFSYEDETKSGQQLSDEILQKLETLNCKFDDCNHRLDKIEATQNYINLNEEPETLQCKSLREYISTGNSYTDMERKYSYAGTSFAYLVPRKFLLHVDKMLSKSSTMRRLCSVEKVSSESVEYLTTDNRNTFVGWGIGDGAETTSPAMKSITINLFEMYAQPKISQKLLNDASINLEDWLINNLVDAFCRMENMAFISGDGYKKPLGIMNYPCCNAAHPKNGATNATEKTHPKNNRSRNDSTTPVQEVAADSTNSAGLTNSSGSIISTTSTGSTNSATPVDYVEYIQREQLTADAIIELYYSLDEYFASKASFLMHRSVLQKIRLLKSSSGQYLLQPGPTGEELLMGIPVYQTSDMPEEHSTATPIVALADFKSAYKIVENSDIRVLRDPYTSKAFVKFYVTKRIGGALVNKNAIKMLKISPLTTPASLPIESSTVQSGAGQQGDTVPSDKTTR